MEVKHKQRLQAAFHQLLTHKRIDVLNILDEYQAMDPELVEIFEELLEAFLSDRPNSN